MIVNTAPLTSETTGIFNAQFFSTLKPTAYFINVARGGSVVTADLQKRWKKDASLARDSTSSTRSRCRQITRCGRRRTC